MRSFGLAVAALALGFGVQAAPAQETRLLFTSLSPAGSPNSQFFNSWAQRVNDQSGGALKIEVRDGTALANFGNSYDRVNSDVVQIGWVQPAFIAGKFPLSEVTNLPFMTDDDVNCSIALWRYYKSAVMAAELQDVVPIWASCLAQSGLHFAEAPRSDTELNGLKMRVAGKVPSQIVERMGGTPVSMTAESIYEALQRGTIDGMVTSWAAFEPYKFQEVAFYHVEVPIGSNPSMFMMSRKKYEFAAARRTQGTRRQLRRGNRARSGQAFFRSSGTRPRRRCPASQPQDRHAPAGAACSAATEAQSDRGRLGERAAGSGQGGRNVSPDLCKGEGGSLACSRDSHLGVGERCVHFARCRGFQPWSANAN